MKLAKENYQKAIDINPRYTDALNNLGGIYKRGKNYDAAIKCFKQATMYNSTLIIAYANLGFCFIKIGNYR